MKQLISILLAFGLMATTQVQADEAAEKKMKAAVAMVKARQGYMRLQSMQLAAMGKAGQGKEAISEETVKRAQNLYNLTLMLPEIFAEGSSMDVVDFSYAKAEIWTNMDDVQGIVSRLNRQAERLLMMAKAGDAMGFKDEFKQVRGSCKSCHEDYKAKAE